MSKYGAPTEFLFGNNIHDFDPDKQSGKRNDDAAPPWYERSATDRPDLDSLVSEVKERIKQITNFVREDGTLITYDQQQGGKQGRSRNSNSIPTLRLENVSFEKRTAEILGTRLVDGRFGKQIMIKLAFAGQTYMWYVNVNGNEGTWCRFLSDNFGSDELMWTGKKFLLFAQHDDFTNTNQIGVAKLEEGSSRRSR